MFEVGDKFYSQCLNMVEIISKTRIKAQWHYVGRIVETTTHMGDLLNKLHKFNEDGKWLDENGKALKKSCHDLKEKI